ncbi:DUF6179 domain-containing protein [Desulfosporosinus fructosivorans]|nr:DUF6179 domain-containing protein [Desulfosporosinus fructosivorans]
MMNNIEKYHLIKREKLNETFYFQSLLEEGYHLKLLTDSEFESIQLQSIQLLAKQTERYTGGESSSVKVEKAQGIMQSIFYCIGIYLKSFPDTDISIATLKHKPLSDLFRQGKQLVRLQLDSARQLLSAIQNDSIITDNCAYNDTIQNGLPIFFSAYDVDFAAHDTPASIDYPLSNDRMDLVGIEYIYCYLQKLSLENQFCRHFTSPAIHCLLRGYDDHYQDLLINIFELVLTNLVGSVLALRNVLQLNIEPQDRQYLQQKLVNLSDDQLDTMLEDASTKLCKELNISDRLLKEHVVATAMNLSPRLKNALENNGLESIFISLKAPPKQPTFQFEDGEKMDDESFRTVANEIRECRYVSDKLAIIQREIHSIADLVDILEGYCLFDTEFIEIFQSLGDMELALLFKRLPTHMIDYDFHITENEKEWHNWLNRFVNELDLTRREGIRHRT